MKEAKLKSLVMDYVIMVTGINSPSVSPIGTWKYKLPSDPSSGIFYREIEINKEFMGDIENTLGLKTDAQKQEFRIDIIKTYGKNMWTNPKYNFMDKNSLVDAVNKIMDRWDELKFGHNITILTKQK